MNFVAECYYKTVTFSAEDFARRLSSFGHHSENRDEGVRDPDISDSDPDIGTTSSLSSASSRSSSVAPLSSNCQVYSVTIQYNTWNRERFQPQAFNPSCHYTALLF